ncbi:MAG: type IV pilus assembly protein FimV [Methylococcales bacterium]
MASVEIPAQAKTTPTAESGMDSTKKENVTHEGQRRAQSPNSDQSSVVPDQVVAGPAAPIEPLTTNEPPPIEPATPVATRSKPAKSDSKPVEEQYSLLHELLSEPDYLKIGGGVAFLLGLIGWVLVRRSNRKMLEDQESLLDSSFSHSDDSDNEGDQKTVYIPVSENTRTVKSSFLSELAPSAFDALETGHEVVDPVSEADVCLAYGRYQQAKDLIRNAIETYPERDEYKLKLLEIHFVTEDREAFEQYAKTLEYLNQERPKLWAKVVALGRELCPENALFKPAESAYRNNALDFEDSLNDGNHSIESDDATSDAVSEFSDLTDMDEIETKLDLAKAYFEMDDQESARGILSEILIEGNDEQKNEARALVDLLDHKV